MERLATFNADWIEIDAAVIWETKIGVVQGNRHTILE